VSVRAPTPEDWVDRFQQSLEMDDVKVIWAGVLFSAFFTGVIWWAGQRLAAIPHLPDTGASWYYWRLSKPSLLARLTAWTFYVSHQVVIWGLIYFAQTRVRRYSTSLHRVNVWALGINAFFILVHFIQTHIWYGALAEDVSIWSSQGSVIVLLVWVLLMENNRRGTFFAKRLPIKDEIIRFARKYHGYFFSWAIIYTFWYHPMEPTSGHLIGFFYMFLLMLQGSLFFTRLHINRWWTLTQELLVLAHGTLVAVMQGNDLWPMFFFGFGGVFVITQMHGVGLSRKVRAAILFGYILLVLWVYSSRGWERLNEIIRIPVIDYLAMVVLAGLFGTGLWLHRQLRQRRQALDVDSAAA
jgi:hypothetical protein